MKYILCLFVALFTACTVIPKESHHLNPQTMEYDGESVWTSKDTKATFEKTVTSYDAESRPTKVESIKFTLDRTTSLTDAAQAHKDEIDMIKGAIDKGVELGKEVAKKAPNIP